MDSVLATAMGSLGQVYCPPFASPAERNRIARRLVSRAKIPLVMSADGAGLALAWTAQGCFRLPEEAAAVLGAGHPFLQQVAADLIVLCHHPEAGQLVLGGWAWQARAISFSHESGAPTPVPAPTRRGPSRCCRRACPWPSMRPAGCGRWTCAVPCWRPSGGEEPRQSRPAVLSGTLILR